MQKKTALVLLFVWPILASLLSFLVKANFLVSTILFLGVPSVFLSWINKKYVKKIGLFAILFAIPIGLIVDYIMEVSGGWYVPSSVWGSFRLFNFVTVDLMIWSILEAYLIPMFYETFLDKRCTPKLFHPSLKYLVIVFYLALGLFVFLYTFNPNTLVINYFYLKMGLVLAAIPVGGTLLKFPKLINKLLLIGSYFFIFNIIYEITAVRLGHWSFPNSSQLIGTVDLLGAHFAFEELLFWMMLTAMAVIAFYEYFDDDRK